MNTIRFAILAIAGCASVAAQATMPRTLSRFGSWSIGSLSEETYADGAADSVGEDYVMTLSQRTCSSDNHNCDALTVSWHGGDTIEVSADFENCSENRQWDPFYSIPVSRWQAAGPAMAHQIEADFKAWIGQAALVCDAPGRGSNLSLGRLGAAVRRFSQLLDERT